MSKSILDFCSSGDPTELFHLNKELAVGSFGTVYEALEKSSNKTIALKIIGLEEDESFEDLIVEIDILKRCQHKNIIGYYGTWLKQKELFIAMELATSGSLLSIYEDFSPEDPAPCSEAEISFVTRETLVALVYLHSNFIIHRDLKAANILVTSDGAVKLADFGVSAIVSPEKPYRGTLIGTPYWMAPEIITMDTSRPYNEKVDIWATGITAIELAEKNPPHDELAPMKALCVIPFDPPPKLKSPSSWSREMNEFVALCLKKNPKDRKSAKELLMHPWIKNHEGCNNLHQLLIKHKKVLEQSEEISKQMATSWQQFLDSQSNQESNDDIMQDSSGTQVVNSFNIANTLKGLKGQNPYATRDNAGKKATVVNPLTGRPSTVRMDIEGRNIEQKKQNEKMFVKNQLKELRKLQAQHQKIIEKQQEKDNKEREQLVQTFQQKSKLNQKNRQDQEVKFRQQQEEFIKKAQLKNQSEIQELQKQLETTQKQKRKQFQEAQKIEIKRWQEVQKQKKRGTGSGLGSFFGKKSSAEKSQEQMEKLKFQNEIQMKKLKEEHGFAFEKLDTILQKEASHLDGIMNMQIKNFKSLHQFRTDTLLLHQDIEKELSLALKKLSAEQNKNIHNLQNEQMTKAFKVQFEESGKYIRTQLKVRQKEFKDSTKQMQRDVDKEEKEAKKLAKSQGLNPKDVVEKFKSKKQKVKEDIDRLEKEFQLESEKFIQEEDKELQAVQKRQWDGMLNQQELDKKRFFHELDKRERNQIESHQNEQRELLKKSNETLFQIFTNQNTQQNDLEKRHSDQLTQCQYLKHKEQMESLLAFHENLKKLNKDLKRGSKELSPEDLQSQIQSLKQEQQQETNALKDMLKKRKDVLLEQQKKKASELKQWNETESKTLRQLHNQHKRAKLQSLKRQEIEMKSSLRVNKMDEDGQTALHVASNIGDFNKAFVLIGEDIDINLQDKKGYTALHNACNGKNKHIVSLLLEQSSVDVTVRNESESTPLHYFCKKFTPDYYDETKECFVKNMIQKGADVNAQNLSGETPLMNTAFSQNIPVAELLLANGASVNARTNKGDSPLLWAIKTSSETMVDFFLSKGADPSVKGRGGLTCLQVAQQFKNARIIEMLQQALQGQYLSNSELLTGTPNQNTSRQGVDPAISLISSTPSPSLPTRKAPQYQPQDTDPSSPPPPYLAQPTSPAPQPKHNSNNGHLSDPNQIPIPTFDPKLLSQSNEDEDEEPTLAISSDSDQEEYDENDLGHSVALPVFNNNSLERNSDNHSSNEAEQYTASTIHLTQKDYGGLLSQLREENKDEEDEEMNLELSDDDE